MAVPKLELDDIAEKVHSGSSFLVRTALRMLRKYPQDDPHVLELTGIAFGYLRQIDNALKCFERGKALSEDPAFDYHIAAALFFKGELERPLAILEGLISAHVPLFTAYVLAMSIYEMREDLGNAGRVCEIALSVGALTGFRPVLLMFRANQLALGGDEERAKQLALEAASIILGRDVKAFAEIGSDLQAYFGRGEVTEIHAKAFVNLFKYWARQELAESSGTQGTARHERLARLQRVYEELVEPTQIDEGTAAERERNDAHVWEAMALYRVAANQLLS